jgi:protein involved in polysaccharide export with SLBB domain
LKNGKIEIKDGRLSARQPGVLNYRPSKLPDALASAGGSVELALQALSDFHYDKLTLAIDKSSTGEGTVLLQLEGQNPAVMSGQVFHFNIRVDSNFDRLADIALASLRSAEELLRRATRRATP